MPLEQQSMNSDRNKMKAWLAETPDTLVLFPVRASRNSI